MLSQTVEDYIKVIYRYQVEDGKETVSTKDISEALDISAASVTSMIKRIAKMGLAEYKSHQGVKLTDAGKKVALEIVRHHRLLELYLSEIMGYSWDEVHDEAEHLEHHISEQFEDTISEMLGHPQYDPHGDPIPTKNGELPPLDSDLLTEVSAEQDYIIKRITDQSPELLRYLGELGLKPNAEIKLLSQAPFKGPVSLTLNEEKVIIGYEVASHIHVVKK